MKLRNSPRGNLKKLEEKASKGKMKQIGLLFEEADIQKLKIKAANQGMTMSEILRKLIKDYLK